MIQGGKEVFCDISPPTKFKEYDKEVTEDWHFKISDSAGDTLIYMANKNKGVKSALDSFVKG